MAKSHLNINKAFMVGNGILAFAVIIIVVIFVYLSFRNRNDDENQRSYAEIYNIQLVTGFTGQSTSLYINDSLIVNQIIPHDSFNIQIKRFAEQSALLVVNNDSEKVSTFDLSERGGNIFLRREGDSVLQEGR